ILVTAGPTREMLDPVRFLSNVSTGHMGYQMAHQAKRMDAQVTLISGPTDLTPPEGIQFVSVLTADDMKRAVLRFWPRTDILIMTAAVCDYTPVRFSPSKIKRVKQKSIQFKRTEDILKCVGRRKGNRVIMGFALETESLKQNALRKLRAKNLDFIVANFYGGGNHPFGAARTSMILMGPQGPVRRFQKMAKARIAKLLLKEILGFWSSKNS
ncbi:MAG: phosphopantothenoylcysteine decarboxylase, partial [Candidatus Omnitrophica bacterium]|nr:phosphopantothenoylcysteine decarboxylase [Candidatus Omnitrophota bacterium]